jgi:hypothetical protein
LKGEAVKTVSFLYAVGNNIPFDNMGSGWDNIPIK